MKSKLIGKRIKKIKERKKGGKERERQKMKSSALSTSFHPAREYIDHSLFRWIEILRNSLRRADKLKKRELLTGMKRIKKKKKIKERETEKKENGTENGTIFPFYKGTHRPLAFLDR